MSSDESRPADAVAPTPTDLQKEIRERAFKKIKTTYETHEGKPKLGDKFYVEIVDYVLKREHVNNGKDEEDNSRLSPEDIEKVNQFIAKRESQKEVFNDLVAEIKGETELHSSDNLYGRIAAYVLESANEEENKVELSKLKPKDKKKIEQFFKQHSEKD